ncbi:MAG TPA: hypothetical protein VH044_11625 [Polyangiaceae bacterium]|nr:hypothetical protein [Polyangiaceae bacterium]
MPALVSAQADQLVRRLGDRATVDDPIFGRSTGMPALARYLEEVAAWLGKHEGAFDQVAFVTGSDRDVTEGLLSLTFEGRRVKVPVAIVAQRRPEREVEVRLYYSTKPIKGTRAVRSPLLPKDDEVAVPVQVAAQLEALSRADIAAVLASFEEGATLRDAAGETHVKTDGGGSLRAFYERMCGPTSGGGGGRGIELLKGARADDGRICALEYTVVRVHGKNVPPQAGLAVYERGETGLLRSVRIYEDVEHAP